MTTLHTLLIGPSHGEFVHPAEADLEEVFTHSLEDAQAAAEDFAGRRLSWQWNDDRQVWRAVTRYGQAAEITSGPRVERIDVGLSTM